MKTRNRPYGAEGSERGLGSDRLAVGQSVPNLPDS